MCEFCGAQAFRQASVQARGFNFTLFLNGFPGGAMVKNRPINAGDATGIGSTPGWGISPGEGNGKPLQYFCLENSMDRGAWPALRSQRVRHDWACMHIHIHIHNIFIYTKTYIRWMKLKLESRLPGEISITSDMQMTPPLWQKVKRN